MGFDFKFKKFSIKQAFFINEIFPSRVKVRKQKNMKFFSPNFPFFPSSFNFQTTFLIGIRAFTREEKMSLIKKACFMLNFLNLKSKPIHLFWGVASSLSILCTNTEIGPWFQFPIPKPAFGRTLNAMQHN